MVAQNRTYTKELDPKLDRADRAITKAYAAGDRRFFDFLREDVRIYTVDSSEPIVGRKAFEAYFGPTLRKLKRKVEIIKRDVQASENTTILAQISEVTTEGITSYVRQTVIWDKDPNGEWKIGHIHNALVGQPLVAGGKLPSTAAAVRVLNERIATVAAAVGVAQ
jgi:ketosteroid isomerase-like protein